MLLVGLTAQNYYNRTTREEKSYNQILEKFVADAKIENFSIAAPENAMAAKGFERHVCGSPAGGYWINANGLQQFGEYLCDRFDKDENFRNAVLQYGQEFYNPRDQTIGHAGELDSSAWFSVHLPSQTTCVMAQDSMVAGITGEQVSHIIAEEQAQLKGPSLSPEKFSAERAADNSLGSAINPGSKT